jgi:hypothetical protein
VKLLLNARPFSPTLPPETWANWLKALDEEAPRTGRIVTAVRFDGVDEPAFRAGEILRRRLDRYERIEVDTATPRALVLRTLTEGAATTGSLGDAATSIAESLRDRDLADAQTMLPQLVDGLRHVVTLTDACAQALGIGLDSISCEGMTFDNWIAEFGRRLLVALEAEGTEDWDTLADCLQYEIGPALRSWGSIFEQLATVAHHSAA